MKKLFLSIITLALLSSIGFAQEAKPAPTPEFSWLVFGGDVKTFPALKAGANAGVEPVQVPTRLFDVRNGNDLTINGTTYTHATYIAFKNNASKEAIIDAICAMGGYQETVPNPAYDPNVGGSQPTIVNPLPKQQFFNKRIEAFIRDNYKAYKISVAEKAAKTTAEAAADAALPPQRN